MLAVIERIQTQAQLSASGWIQVGFGEGAIRPWIAKEVQ